MPAESLYGPIPREAIRQARARLALEGLSVEQWARREGFEAKTVYNVLSGRRMCIRGRSLQIAVKLGLRPDPSAAAQKSLPGQSPAGRTLAGGAPIASCDRRPLLQGGRSGRRKLLLGEAVR